MRGINKQTMLDLIIEAKRNDPETGSFAEWLAEYLAEHMPTLTPPNEALTLEQLRKMDGEPVYIIIDDVEPLKMWVLIEADGEDIYLTNNLGGRSYYEEARKLYKFKLYRRPPEVSP